MIYRLLGRTGPSLRARIWRVTIRLGIRRLRGPRWHQRGAYGLRAGRELLHVSPYYGANRAETVLGKALRGIGRARYLLATKVGRYGDEDFDFSAERAKHSVRESPDRLGTDHVDLIQCHDIEFGDLDQIVEETLPALRELQDAGLAASSA